MATIQQLKRAILKANSALGIPDAIYSIEESKPDEFDNSGNIQVDVDQSLKLQFAANGCTCLCAVYWSDGKGSRSEAIKSLISDIERGFEPMSKETAYACGVDI